MADRHKVLELVQEAISIVQRASGRDTVRVSEETNLHHDIDGFDSLNSLEVLVHVSGELGTEIPDKVLSKIVGDPELTVASLTEQIYEIAEKQSIAG